MLSYHADMTLDNNPYELGMDRLVDLDMDADFVSKEALKKIKADGVQQVFVGLEIEGAPIIGANDAHWPITKDGVSAGYVTSAIYSPRLKANIALAMVASEFGADGTEMDLTMVGETRRCKIVPKPFYDPKKSIAAKG